ncbi:MAG: S9 family peptidase [Chloroflexi bacterium]|nr:S9 family peptidase [Chloroflexota bacterium]MYD17508.1 S9 family peptidase [Chloroflexota bacterium]
MSEHSGKPTPAPYGSWESPVKTEMLTQGALRFDELDVDGDDLYWVESRPDERGRYAAMRYTASGELSEITTPGFSARTLVHEYGGGSLAVSNSVAYFSNFSDQRLYRRDVDGSGEPTPLTPEIAVRYADATVDDERGRLICVAEDHRREGLEAENYLASISTDGSASDADDITRLHEGFDFCSSPRLSPDGRRLAWICWNHPSMPWDATELWLAEVAASGSLLSPRRIAGDAKGNVSIIEPQWGPDGTLYCVSDESGWWNIQRWTGTELVSVLPMDAEFGQPQWEFSMSSYAVMDECCIVAQYGNEDGRRLGVIDVEEGELRELDTPFSTLGFFTAAVGPRAICAAAGPDVGAAIVAIDVDSGEIETLRASAAPDVDAAYFSQAEAITYPTAGGLVSHAYYYAPNNPDFAGPEDELPPLVTFIHGGPTSATNPGFALAIQFWTTRGFAVVDVNYRGSTGYGTAYRRQLNGNWGIADREDCEAAARYLVERGDVDPNRLAIRGGSAGGYTTLCALTFGDVFTAGASYYGVSDAAALAEDTHKFESRYLDSLIGPYPERAELYEQRSPIHSVDRLSCPVIFLQGLEDKIVPPNQAERMVDALRKKGLPVAYIAFEGEQHGFRQAANIQRATEAELDFYGRIFGFSPAGEIEPVEIENL